MERHAFEPETIGLSKRIEDVLWKIGPNLLASVRFIRA